VARGRSQADPHTWLGYGGGWQPSLGVLSVAIGPERTPNQEPGNQRSGNRPVDCAIDTNRAGRLRNRQVRAAREEANWVVERIRGWLPVAGNGRLGVELRSRSGESGSGVALGAVSGVTASAVDRGGCRVSS